MSCKTLTKQQRKQYVQIFKAIDVDNDESLTRQEMIDGKAEFLLGDNDLMTDEEIDEFITLADANEDGEISLEEFITGATKFEQIAAEEKLKEAFALFDKDNDGFIDAPELLNALSFLPNFDIETAQSALEAHDANGDGKMDYDEFKEFVSTNDTFQ